MDLFLTSNWKKCTGNRLKDRLEEAGRRVEQVLPVANKTEGWTQGFIDEMWTSPSRCSPMIGVSYKSSSYLHREKLLNETEDQISRFANCI